MPQPALNGDLCLNGSCNPPGKPVSRPLSGPSGPIREGIPEVDSAIRLDPEGFTYDRDHTQQSSEASAAVRPAVDEDSDPRSRKAAALKLHRDLGDRAKCMLNGDDADWQRCLASLEKSAAARTPAAASTGSWELSSPFQLPLLLQLSSATLWSHGMNAQKLL